MEHDVFISYSRMDRKVAIAICYYLEQKNIKCFIAPRDIPNDSYHPPIAIGLCEVFVLVFSMDYYRRLEFDNFDNAELNAAIISNKRIIIYRIDNTPYLDNYFGINAFPNSEEHFDKLYESVKMHLRPKLQREQPPLRLKSSCKQGKIEYKKKQDRLQTDSKQFSSMDDVFGGLMTAVAPSVMATCIGLLRNTFKNAFKKQKSHQLSLFSPSKLNQGEEMLVQLYLHREIFTEKISLKASMKDSKSTLRGNESLNILLKKGDEIEVKLLMPQGVLIDEPIQKVIWEYDLKSVDFVVFVPPDYKLGDMIGTVIICKDSLPLCSVKFVTKITCEPIVSSVPDANFYPVFYKKVFISYSSKDREEVIKISTGLKALHVDFFLDKLYLDGGDKYKNKIFSYIDKADLFILCWSSNAAQSEWVKKEYLHALQRINKPDMSLVLYPIIIEPRALPPNELNEYHFVEL